VSVFGGRRRASTPPETTAGTREESPRRPAVDRSTQPAVAKAPPAGDGGSNGRQGAKVANIGKSISIHGDLTGDEDLLLEGTVEGKVLLPNNELTIGADGRIPADVSAKSVIVIGHVKGDVEATERIEIRNTGVVDGNIRAPSLVIADGAVLNGNIEMGAQASAAKAESTVKKSVAQPQPGAPAPPPAG
jgi:cytoskeletal protein CcmA (bactofilin family)